VLLQVHIHPEEKTLTQVLAIRMAALARKTWPYAFIPFSILGGVIGCEPAALSIAFVHYSIAHK
jgi:hypothetical protein